MGLAAVEGLSLDMNMVKKNRSIMERRTSQASHQQSSTSRSLQISYTHLHGAYNDFPKRLRWLYWRGFPLKCIPEDFPLKSLAVLDMQRQLFGKTLWDGRRVLQLLKILNLNHSHSLYRTPDFQNFRCWRRLVLKDCVNLVEDLDLSNNPISSLPDCIRTLSELNILELSRCTMLKSLINLPSLPGLEAMEGIEKTMKSLELSMWDTVGSFEVKLYNHLTSTESRGPLKVLFENGMISIFLPGSKGPNWFCYKSAGATLSFTVPSPPDLKIQSITVCSVYTIDWKVWKEGIQFYSIIHNEQKNVKLIYSPTCYGLPEAQNEMLWFSHWKFKSQLDAGDTLNVTVLTMDGFSIKEIGIHLMHGEQVDMLSNSNSREMQQDYPYQGRIPAKRQGLVDLYCFRFMGIGLGYLLPILIK
ncbi:hypothetical protein HAX54_023747 [Datura stramonium]|uniref:Uncharacterized protein n=1 Tax=Datura stramonium TaxID=4076 RepID=A0ABS8UX28_DATST|nr:hypothetical protein [Datura stramonium]